MKITLEVSPTFDDDLIGQVVDGLRERAGKKLDDAIETLVVEHVEAKVMEVTTERVAAAVDKVLAEGWQPTDEYGCPRGDKLSLAGRVSKVIAERDRYDCGRRKIDSLIDDAVKEYTRSGLEDDLKDLRAKFKAEVNALMQTKIAEELARAIGIGGAR